jgi:trehalose utilization protein
VRSQHIGEHSCGFGDMGATSPAMRWREQSERAEVVSQPGEPLTERIRDR